MVEQPAKAQGREARRAHGVYYTPRAVADYITRRTLLPLLEQHHSSATPSLTIVDPACGEGVFLQAAFGVLLEWYGGQIQRGNRKPLQSSVKRLEPAERRRILLSHLYGVDQDEAALKKTRATLARLCCDAPSSSSGSPDPDAARPDPARPDPAQAQLESDLCQNIRHGNALIEPSFQVGAGRSPEFDRSGSVQPFDWQNSFPEIAAADGFDAVIGNPPYINIRRLTAKHGDAVKSYFAQRYQCAYRGYDTYVLFIEKAVELLRPDGRCGFIVPNKIASLDYGLRCRELLLQKTTLLRIDDLADANVFPRAGVYPYILVFSKQTAPRGHRIRIGRAKSIKQLPEIESEDLLQADLSAETGLAIHGRLNVESRVPTLPLAELARLHSGTTGFQAARVAKSLVDLHGDANSSDRWREDCRCGSGQMEFDFVVSGNIRRYGIRIGKVRFMRQRYQRPILRWPDCDLSPSKLDLFRDSKVVISGLSRRLKVAYDPGGLALGVQVYAATTLKLDYRYLLALLNTKLLSYIFQLRYQAKRLGGRYLAVNKGQLAQLPIRIIDASDAARRAHCDRIIQLVEWMHELMRSQSTDHQKQRQIDRAIDSETYQLYDLTAKEIQQVEENVTD